MSASTTFPFISGCSPVQAQFQGVPQATLRQWLIDAQQAVHDLTIGTKPSVVLYNSGDGTRQVTYTRTSMGQLQAYIQALNAALGGRQRRAIGVRFGG